jgi:iron complex outermembrane receptor protein
MYRKSQVCSAVLAALGASVMASPALAQQAAEQRVEITGSAMKRIGAEGALPVQIIRREEIARSGATSVTDLIQRLPGMQGATTESASVGGAGGGFAGASIHGLGEARTLVLLNGRRLALALPLSDVVHSHSVTRLC